MACFFAWGCARRQHSTYPALVRVQIHNTQSCDLLSIQLFALDTRLDNNRAGRAPPQNEPQAHRPGVTQPKIRAVLSKASRVHHLSCVAWSPAAVGATVPRSRCRGYRHPLLCPLPGRPSRRVLLWALPVGFRRRGCCTTECGPGHGSKPAVGQERKVKDVKVRAVWS